MENIHFRFKFADKQYGYSWMVRMHACTLPRVHRYIYLYIYLHGFSFFILLQDISNRQDVLPIQDGILTVKALRVDQESAIKRKLFLKKSVIAQFGRDGSPKRSANKGTSALNSEPPVPQRPVSVNKTTPTSSADPPPPEPQQDFDFFNGGSPVASSSGAGIDIDIDEDTQTTNIPVTLSRQDLKEKREEEIQDRVAAALKEKKEVWWLLLLM